MPNWVYNDITVSGDKSELERMEDLLDGDNGPIDFNKVVPMPGSLRLPASPITERLAKCAAIKKYGTNLPNELKQRFEPYGKLSSLSCDEILDEFPDLPESADKSYLFHECNAFAACTPKSKADAMYIGSVALDNIERYGASDWYGWCNRYWGTKWNADGPELGWTGDESVNMRFTTAWSAPIPLLEELVRLFPDLAFDGQYADEDVGGDNCGCWHGFDSVLEMDDIPDGMSSLEFACSIWDIDPSEYDEEDEEDEEENAEEA